MDRKIEEYLKELFFWNKKINLTGISKKGDFYKKIIIENLRLTEVLNIDEEKIIIDVGSGNGNLGILFALKKEKNRVFLVEKDFKKAVFLKEMKRRLKLKNVEVVNDRIENISFFTGNSKNFLFFFRAFEISPHSIKGIMKKFKDSTFIFLIGENSRGKEKIEKIKIPNLRVLEKESGKNRKIVIMGKKINILQE